MSIGHIWGIIAVVAGVINLLFCYFVATDKIKQSKLAQIFSCVFISLYLFGSAVKAFLK